MPGDSGHHQSDGKERVAVMVATTYPMKPGALGKNLCDLLFIGGRREPCLEALALSIQMREGEALMVATTYPMKPGALGENLGGLHLITRRESHAWKQWPSPIK